MANGKVQRSQHIGNQTEDSAQVPLNCVGSAPSVAGGKLKISNIPLGSVALASVGTNTTDAIQLWVTDIFVPINRLITTVGVLQGGTAGTDKILVAIYNAQGYLQCSSALAGLALNGSANTFLELAIAVDMNGNSISNFQMWGPGQYYIAVQGNGTAAGAIQTVPAPYLDICANSVAAGTFGTLPAKITPPTTFTAGTAPVVYVY